MTQGMFITGTDTGVGKTLVSAACLARWHGIYWKPVQTGPAADHDQPYIQALTGADDTVFFPTAYAFPDPKSPHIAAENCQKNIDPDYLRQESMKLFSQFPEKPIVIEGAGGVMVPITRDYLMIDLMADLNLPVLLVCRTALGTINHSLLSIAALRQAGLTIAGVVFSGPPHPAEMKTICDLGQVRQLAHFPEYPEISSDILTEAAGLLPDWSDMQTMLMEGRKA